jgi:DNA-binding HxlR family transcriptional regulator
VRELLAGPKRYTELAQALPGIPTNVLASRLRELDEAGLVERELQDGAATSVVYVLTPYGLELEGPLIGLGMWGAKSLGPPRPGDSFSLGALQVALRGTFDPNAAGGRELVAEIDLGHGRLNVHVHDGQVTFPRDLPSAPHLVLDTAPEVFAEMFRGLTDVDDAVASGRARRSGSKQDARRFFRIFHLPAGGAHSVVTNKPDLAASRPWNLARDADRRRGQST